MRDVSTRMAGYNVRLRSLTAPEVREFARLYASQMGLAPQEVENYLMARWATDSVKEYAETLREVEKK